MRYLKIVNRTSRTLHGLWDGRHYDIPPGPNSFPEVMARKFKDQNPRMGTMNPVTLQMEYLIGIEEERDDCSPIEQSDAIEKLDRKELSDEPVTVIKGKGLYSPTADASKPLGANVDFTQR